MGRRQRPSSFVQRGPAGLLQQGGSEFTGRAPLTARASGLRFSMDRSSDAGITRPAVLLASMSMSSSSGCSQQQPLGAGSLLFAALPWSSRQETVRAQQPSCAGQQAGASSPAASSSTTSGSDATANAPPLAHMSRSSAVAITTAAAAVAALPIDGVAEVVVALVLHCKLLFAGAMSAVVSRTAMAPLERVKMDQVLKAAPRGVSTLEAAALIFRNEGVGGFWKGNALNLLRTAPYKAVNFTGYELYSSLFAALAGHDSNAARFGAGACAGITATMICFPLDVLRTRMMAPGSHKYGGALQTLRGIVRHEGLPALYAGVVPAIIGMAPAGAVFYGSYNMLKQAHLERMAAAQQEQQQAGGGSSSAGSPVAASELELPAGYTLLYGAAAGACSELVVYPLEVLRRRMQLQSMHAAKAAAQGAAPAAAATAGAVWGRIAAAAGALAREGGVRAFYAGMAPNMLQVLPSAALSYGTYEFVKHYLGAHLPHHHAASAAAQPAAQEAAKEAGRQE